ncbi:MAG: cobaltochelatase CobT-related protein, partial [Gammaproteobacteria bacterium]
RLVFEWLEQLRTESLVAEHQRGARQNLIDRFQQWSLNFHRDGLTDTHLGILLYTMAQMAWARLFNLPVLEETGDFIEATRAGLAPMIGAELGPMKHCRHDQASYAKHALNIANTIDQLIESQGDLPAQADDEDQETTLTHLYINFDEETDEEGLSAAYGDRARDFVDEETPYRVFTTEFDREVDATSLVRGEKLDEYRQRLDQRIRESGINGARLARLLSAQLGTPSRDGWDGAREEGVIDGRMLSQLISSPAERRLFRQDRFKPLAHCAVSFLMDCSGSMKIHAESMGALLDVHLRALERAGVETEFLGFTTWAWNGGRAYQRWLSGGRPSNPGRLNERCHIRYKTHERAWRRARPAISALLKQDIYRESLDGEALEWAADRLRRIDARRRILVVLSDGCPSDTASNNCNDQDFLETHLKEVVMRLEWRDGIEVCGVGVGLDLSPYYQHSLAVDLSKPLGNELAFELANFYARPKRQ